MKTRHFLMEVSFLLTFLLPIAQADIFSKRSSNEKSPSKDQVLWTETNIGYDFAMEYNYVGPSSIGFADGQVSHLSEHVTDFRQVITQRSWLAFLFHLGLEWQRLEFDPPNRMPVPGQLDVMNAFLATDFRWSNRDMMRLQVQPGFYTDLQDMDLEDFNVPVALAYTHVSSKDLQWTIGLSINTLRKMRYLPGGGFRWQINDRWKLKFLLPTPQVEYKLRDDLHVWAGGDFRGDTYRVSRHFGDDRGNPALNHALLDYEEIRMGTGVSWNIRPLVELNGEIGYMMDRQFDYFNNAVSARGHSAPYVNVSLHILFQLLKDSRPMNEQIRSMQIKFPSFQRLFKIPGN